MDNPPSLLDALARLFRVITGDPIAAYLTNWNILHWILMLFITALAFGATFIISATLGEGDRYGHLTAAGFAAIFYLWALSRVLRHIPWQTAVTILIAAGLVASLAALVRFGTRGPWPYGIVLGVPFLAAVFDRSSRAIAGVPTNWTTIIIVVVALLAVFQPWRSRRIS